MVGKNIQSLLWFLGFGGFQTTQASFVSPGVFHTAQSSQGFWICPPQLDSKIRILANAMRLPRAHGAGKNRLPQQQDLIRVILPVLQSDFTLGDTKNDKSAQGCPTRKLCAISPAFSVFTRMIPKSPGGFGMCWRLSASKRVKKNPTESKNPHKPHETTITKAGAAMPDGKTESLNPSKITSQAAQENQDSQEHQFFENCAAHFPGNLHPLFSSTFQILAGF